jgi:hypothetical protein
MKAAVNRVAAFLVAAIPFLLSACNIQQAHQAGEYLRISAQLDSMIGQGDFAGCMNYSEGDQNNVLLMKRAHCAEALGDRARAASLWHDVSMQWPDSDLAGIQWAQREEHRVRSGGALMSSTILQQQTAEIRADQDRINQEGDEQATATTEQTTEAADQPALPPSPTVVPQPTNAERHYPDATHCISVAQKGSYLYMTNHCANEVVVHFCWRNRGPNACPTADQNPGDTDIAGVGMGPGEESSPFGGPAVGTLRGLVIFACFYGQAPHLMRRVCTDRL